MTRSTVKISRQTAQLISVYCKMQNLTVQSYAESVFEKELGEFKKVLEDMKFK